MDVRFGFLLHFLLGGSWALDATELEATEVETSDSDAPDSEIKLVFFNQLNQGNETRGVQTPTNPPSRGRTGSPGQACVLGWGGGSTQPVPAIIAEVRPAVSTPIPAVETFAESNQAAATRSQLVGQKRLAPEGGHSPNESVDQSRVAQTSASPSSQGGRTGLPLQACLLGWGRGSTQPVPAIIAEVRPAVPTPTPAVETSAEANHATATRSQLVGQKRPALEGGHSPNESAKARPRVESSGASSRLGYTMPPIRWGLSMPISNVPHPRQNSESLLYDPEFTPAVGQAPAHIPGRQSQMSLDMGSNLDALQVTSAQVLGQLTSSIDHVNNQLKETRKRLEAAERATTNAVEEKTAAVCARIAAEEEAATKLESLRAEHQSASSALRLRYETALNRLYRRLQELEASLVGGQARQEAMASKLEAVNGELMNEADYYGQRYRRSAIFLIKERYPNLDLDGIDFESLNSESLLYDSEYTPAFGQAPAHIPGRQSRMSLDIGSNLNALQVTSAQVLGQLTSFNDHVNNQLKETRKRLEAAERATTKAVEEKTAAVCARIAAEEEAATKVESLRAEHQSALSALRLRYETALNRLYHRLQELEASLVDGQARQEAMASKLEAVNGELMNEADYYGQRYRRSAIFLIKERYPNLDLDDIDFDSLNSDSLLYDPEFTLAFGQAPAHIPGHQSQMSLDMGSNLDALQVTSAQVLGQLTSFIDRVNNQPKETRKRLEAAERATTKAVEEKTAAVCARIAAEEEAATKVESLRAEHQSALSALRLRYETALNRLYRRLQELEASLVGGQARQEAMASKLEAVNGELMNEADYYGQRYRRSAIFLIKERYPNLDLDGIDFESLRGAEDGESSTKAHEAETMVVLFDEDVAEGAIDSAQPLAGEGPTEWAGGEEGDAIEGLQGGPRICGG